MHCLVVVLPSEIDALVLNRVRYICVRLLWLHTSANEEEVFNMPRRLRVEIERGLCHVDNRVG